MSFIPGTWQGPTRSLCSVKPEKRLKLRNYIDLWKLQKVLQQNIACAQHLMLHVGVQHCLTVFCID